jgi:hypothetical protein
VLTPVVNEVPRADTTRLAELDGYPTQALESVADMLRAIDYLSPSERSSLHYVERELRLRVRREADLDDLALAA